MELCLFEFCKILLKMYVCINFLTSIIDKGFSLETAKYKLQYKPSVYSFLNALHFLVKSNYCLQSEYQLQYVTLYFSLVCQKIFLEDFCFSINLIFNFKEI